MNCTACCPKACSTLESGRIAINTDILIHFCLIQEVVKWPEGKTQIRNPGECSFQFHCVTFVNTCDQLCDLGNIIIITITFYVPEA